MAQLTNRSESFCKHINIWENCMCGKLPWHHKSFWPIEMTILYVWKYKYNCSLKESRLLVFFSTVFYQSQTSDIVELASWSYVHMIAWSYMLAIIYNIYIWYVAIIYICGFLFSCSRKRRWMWNMLHGIASNVSGWVTLCIHITTGLKGPPQIKRL